MPILILVTEVVEKLVLALLLGLSVWSISIMIDRLRVFGMESLPPDLQKSRTLRDWAQIRSWSEQNKSTLIGGALNAALGSQNALQVDRAVASFVKSDRIRLEKGLTVLATLGSNAPFIGLFGTVLGIIRAFAYLGSQSGSAAVMSGVSQALFATALGLIVAIPAVVAYNVFSKKLRDLLTQTESLRDAYVAQLNEK